MPVHLKALVVILILATVVFTFAKAPACALASTTGDFERRRNLWFGITLAAFLAHSFWIYIVAVAFLLLLTLPREPNKLAMFFFLLFAVPTFEAPITGLGVIQHLFTIHYIRLLALVVLFAAFLYLQKQPDTERFGRTLSDKLIAGYIILQFLLMLTVSTFTNSLRIGVFYAFIDVFLPYYVASRSLKNIEGFRDALMAFVTAAMVLSIIAAFEVTRHWLLYANVDDALGTPSSHSIYLERGQSGVLRASASTGHAIPLGYAIAVALGFFLYLRKSVRNPLAWALGLALLLAGLAAPLSRGPWVGAAVMFLVFLATGPSPVRRLLQVGLLGIVIVPILLTTSLGDKFIALLPFVGTVDEFNVNYRQRLLAIGIQVIMQNPFFGAYGFFLSPEMQELKYGNGMIDLVNTYLGIGLASGLVGLSLFLGFFIAAAIGIFNGMRKLSDRNSELYLLGQALLSTLLGILVIIFTTSSISVIPVIYWSVAGLGVAYARMLVALKAPAKVPKTAASIRVQPVTINSGSYVHYRKWADK